MNLWHSIGGMIEADMASAELETAFAVISEEGIEIYGLQRQTQLKCSFWVRRKHWPALLRVCKKRGYLLNRGQETGLPRVIHHVVKRKILMAGILGMLFMVLWMPSRVLFVCVEGNDEVPDRRILEAAERCGIGFGASRRQVRSEKMKNALLREVPQLQWAGVNTSGCTAIISVRERGISETEEKGIVPASIVAGRDGYILSCTALCGNLLVAPGETVKQGQILISAYTDCGFCIRAERADGEIIALTRRKAMAITPSEYLVKNKLLDTKVKISLLLRKKRIFLWKYSGICDAGCGRMYEEYYVTLPGGFRLPVALCVEKYCCYETEPSVLSLLEAEMLLSDAVRRELTQKMVAGRIINGDQNVFLTNGAYCLNGEYSCSEMIGKIRQEQIGDRNGKNN